MNFGDKIVFNIVYSETATKDYEELKSRTVYKRIVKVEKLDEYKKGIVIGQTFKFDGIYHVNDKYRNYSFYEDQYPPTFTPQARIDFWIVATDMNVQYLVPKKEVKDFRIVSSH